MATRKAAKKSAPNKATSKKTSAKKTAAKKTAAKKSSGSEYGPAAARQIETELHEMHQGTLKSGRSGRMVTNPRQAIAIALSEARRKGAKVPQKRPT